ncbi:zinc finger-like domain-containing protein [Candidatus Bathyarchaeota archaeon]|nr:zinc finger-like domain-containing protein [Candidatus Bathyarchaeota archaeon]
MDLNRDEDKDARLARIKAEYLALSAELARLRERLEASKAKTRRLRALMEAVERGLGIPEQECQELGITKSKEKPDDLFLKFRLQGLIRASDSEEARLSDKIDSLERLTKELEVCPECGGRGRIRTRLEYETMEGGIVVPKIEEKSCGLCEGKGRLRF